MKRPTWNAILTTLACAALATAVADGQNRMTVTFDGKNVLQSIKVGASTFATGGGDLWTAEFSDGTNRAKRVKACAHEAATCERTETDTTITLFWRDVPLGGERGQDSLSSLSFHGAQYSKRPAALQSETRTRLAPPDEFW